MLVNSILVHEVPVWNENRDNFCSGVLCPVRFSGDLIEKKE